MRWNEIIFNDANRLVELFYSHKNIFRFVGSFLAITLTYFILTGILLLNPIDVNPSLSALNVGLTLIISGLTALNAVIVWNRLDQQSLFPVPKKSFAGSLLGLFASSCPICQPIWLLWLGLGSATAFLIEYSTIIAVIGIGFLLYSTHRLLATPVDCSTSVTKK